MLRSSSDITSVRWIRSPGPLRPYLHIIPDPATICMSGNGNGIGWGSWSAWLVRAERSKDPHLAHAYVSHNITSKTWVTVTKELSAPNPRRGDRKCLISITRCGRLMGRPHFPAMMKRANSSRGDRASA